MCRVCGNFEGRTLCLLSDLSERDLRYSMESRDARYGKVAPMRQGGGWWLPQAALGIPEAEDTVVVTALGIPPGSLQSIAMDLTSPSALVSGWNQRI